MFAVVSTPSAGIHRVNHDIPSEPCSNCGNPLTRFVAWPRPDKYGCVKRGCALSVVGEGGERGHGRNPPFICPQGVLNPVQEA